MKFLEHGAQTALPFLMNSPTKFIQSQATAEKEISCIRDFLSRYREAMLLAFNVAFLMVVLMLTLLHNSCKYL